MVRVFTGGQEGEPMAAFRVGKSPKGAYDVFFVRSEEGDTVYRTRTILTEDQRKGGADPWDQTEGANAFQYPPCTNTTVPRDTPSGSKKS